METTYDLLNAKFKSEGNFTLLELVSLLQKKETAKKFDPSVSDSDERPGKFETTLDESVPP